MVHPRWMGLIFLVIIACGESPAEPMEESVVGIIVPWGRSEADVQVVADDAAVTVSVTTYGDGCYSKGETVVDRVGARAEVVPMDVRTTVPGQVCPDILRDFTHVVEVTFDTPRPWIVEVRGRRVPSEDTVTVTRVVE